MNWLPQNGESLIVPYAHLPIPDGFEVCWAGEFSVPFPLIPALLCFGSVDGNLLFANQELTHLVGSKAKASVSGEAINGVAWSGTWAAVSTRQEVSFWSLTGPQGGHLPHGAHGITTTRSGYFIAPLGRTGILTAKPPSGDEAPLLMAHRPDENLYVYRVTSVRSQTGVEVLACAARLGGVVAGIFSGSQETHTMNTARFKNFDVVDICPLCPELDSLAVAALGRDGSLILFRDVLSDKNPKRFKFQSIKGVAYRILCRRGDIYVLTSKGLYVLGKLGSCYVNGELEGTTTPVLPLETVAVDMNLAWGRWLLVVLANEVRRLDVDLIHEYVPQHIGHGEIQEFQPVFMPLEPDWKDITPTSQPLEVAS